MFSGLHASPDKINIYKLPQYDSLRKLDVDVQLTIGDLHGNSIKLLYILLEYGIAYNLSEYEYRRLVELYELALRNNHQTHHWHLFEFRHLLDKLKFRNHALLRLIGDETADRGANDFFTLALLEKLNDNEVKIEILLSNHGFEFIYAYEKYPGKFHSDSDYYNSPQFASLKRMAAWVYRKLIGADEVTGIIENVYKPALKILSYALSKDGDEISLFTHAGVGLETIERLAIIFGVDYKDSSAGELAATIDAINEKFKERVNSNKVHELGERFKYPDVFSIMWNREYSKLNRPNEHNGYRINYIHGHDKDDPGKDFIFTLDNNVGKVFGYADKQSHHVSRPKLQEHVPAGRMDIEMVEIPLQTTRDYGILGWQIFSDTAVPLLSHQTSELEAQYKEGKPIAILNVRNNWHLEFFNQSRAVYYFGEPQSVGDSVKLTLENFDKQFLDNILQQPNNEEFVSRVKAQFLLDLQHKLTTGNLLRTDILDLFQQINDRNGQYALIHQQRNKGWDNFRLLFKMPFKRKPGEQNLWQTATFQSAVKMLKNAYIKLPDKVDETYRQAEQDFIDFRRGNAPLCLGKTATRQLMISRYAGG